MRFARSKNLIWEPTIGGMIDEISYGELFSNAKTVHPTNTQPSELFDIRNSERSFFLLLRLSYVHFQKRQQQERFHHLPISGRQRNPTLR